MNYVLNNGTVAYFKITDTDIGNAVMAYYIAKGTGYSCFFFNAVDACYTIT